MTHVATSAAERDSRDAIADRLITVSIVACPRCGRPTQIREHRSISEKHLRQHPAGQAIRSRPEHRGAITEVCEMIQS